MRVPFHKMHGAGNDFVVVDERASPLALTAAPIAALADRRTGIGCDQLITLQPAPGADALMRIFNPDGSEAGACGNATRCVADLLFRETGRPDQAIRTVAGLLPPSCWPTAGSASTWGRPRSAGGTSRSRARPTRCTCRCRATRRRPPWATRTPRSSAPSWTSAGARPGHRA